MKLKVLMLLFMCALYMTPPFLSNADTFSAEMVLTGTWHGDEVSAENGQTWLALTETGEGFELQAVAITVDMVVDEILDTPPAKTGKKVAVANIHDPIMLLRNLPQLKPGAVNAAEIIDRDFSAGKPTGIYFDGMVYELQISCDEETIGKEIADCPLQLSGSGAVQTLMSYPVYNPGTSKQSIASEAFPQMLWAGDLDRDGKLDFIIDLTNHYNVSAPTLLLSCQAAEGKHVRPVAEFRTTGC